MKRAIDVIKKHSFKMKKVFGQNFLTDETLLQSIVEEAGITKEDTVVEIGPGAGTLTRELAKVAKKVVCYEIDKTLTEILEEMLEDFENVDVRFQDIMKVKKKELSEIGPFKVVANLPYYITTPILMFFLEEIENVTSLSLMVQYEVAKRFCAKAGTSEYGAITVAIDLEGEARIVKKVGRENFLPRPNVDSAVVRIDVDRTKHDCNKDEVKRLVKSAFKMRRKMLTNNLVNDYALTKTEAEEVLANGNINKQVRGEKLTTKQFIELAERIKMVKNIT